MPKLSIPAVWGHHQGEGVSTVSDLRAALEGLAVLPLPVSLYQHTHSLMHACFLSQKHRAPPATKWAWCAPLHTSVCHVFLMATLFNETLATNLETTLALFKISFWWFCAFKVSRWDGGDVMFAWRCYRPSKTDLLMLTRRAACALCLTSAAADPKEERTKPLLSSRYLSLNEKVVRWGVQSNVWLHKYSMHLPTRSSRG